MKAGIRKTRGIAPPIIVRGTTKVRNWKQFLKNDSNKQSLFQYIAVSAQTVELADGNQFVFTFRDSVITNPKSLAISQDLSPCDHKKVDTRMILHLHQILSTASSVMLRTVDADVLVLAISASAKYDDKYIYVDFGVVLYHKNSGCTSVNGLRKELKNWRSIH